MQPKHLGFTTQTDEQADYEKMRSNVMEEVKRAFKPEFLNRIDETIVFHSLTKDTLRQIAGLQLDIIVKRCREQLNIKLNLLQAVTNNKDDSGNDETNHGYIGTHTCSQAVEYTGQDTSRKAEGKETNV